MTVDRTELCRLLEVVGSSGAIGDPYWDAMFRLKNAVPKLIDELDAKDRRIAELETGLREAIGYIDPAYCDDGTENSTHDRLAKLLPSEET